LCFLSLPFILFVSQSISQKVLQPPKDPKKVLSEQELFSQGILNNLPLVVAFFSINVPAGLAVYWIVNNLLTTAVTLALKSQIKDEGFPLEVLTMMEMVDAPVGASSKKSSGSSNAEMNRRGLLLEEKIGKKEGFGSKAVVDVEGPVSEEEIDGDNEEDDVVATEEAGTETEGGDAEGGAKKRKKRVKPAAMRKDKKRKD
jgi:YidC/Oxa1 family membrane protein insertase